MTSQTVIATKTTLLSFLINIDTQKSYLVIEVVWIFNVTDELLVVTIFFCLLKVILNNVT